MPTSVKDARQTGTAQRRGTCSDHPNSDLAVFARGMAIGGREAESMCFIALMAWRPVFGSKGKKSVSTQQQFFCIFATKLGLGSYLSKSRFLAKTPVSPYLIRTIRKSCYVRNRCPAGFVRPLCRVRDNA